MKTKDIRAKSDTELQKLLFLTREKLRDLRFKDANKQIKAVRDLRKNRKLIAQIKTVLKEGNTKNAKETKNAKKLFNK